jgi:hypothetical protein
MPPALIFNFTLITIFAGIAMGAWYCFIIVFPIFLAYMFIFFLFIRPKFIQSDRKYFCTLDPQSSHLTTSLDGIDSILAYDDAVKMELRLNDILDKSAKWRLVQVLFII